MEPPYHGARYSFELKKTPTTNGVARNYAQFTCRDCSNTLDIPYTGLKPPGVFIKKARTVGWDVSDTNAAKSRCPTCVTPAKREVETTGAPMDNVATLPSISLASASGLTSDKRLTIRGLLDKHFDDAAGEYLDDMTDARLGEIANLPRAWITTIRETAYGPIRVDPEIKALRTRIAAIEAAVGEAKAALARHLQSMAAT